MSQIPDARDFIHKNWREISSDIDITAQKMVDFAKLHVQDALKSAQEIIGKNTVPNCSDHTPFWGICVTCGRYDNPEMPADDQTIKDAILKSYPLTNIK